jgi:hypothetical protein
MPQGTNKKKPKPKTHKKAEINQKPKRVWKKRSDPIKAAIVKEIEGIAMERAPKDPLHGGLRLIKPSEQNVKAAKVSTKSLIRNPNQQIK